MASDMGMFMKNYFEMRKQELRKRGNKGFTLMEMLIVVAIIAVLVAIAIPVFTSQLEKSKEATDIANVRSAYAEVTTNYLTNGQAETSATVSAQQGQSGWQGEEGKLVTRVNGSESEVTYSAKTTGNSYTVTIDASGAVTVN